MKIHITLVGAQVAPVYHGIIATNPDKVIFVHSSSTKKAIYPILYEINIPYELVELSPTEPKEIFKKAIELAEKYVNDDVTVNISGGTKAWAYFFSSTFDKLSKAEVVYMDQNNILWNYKTLTSSSDFTFDMRALFRIYGNPIDNHYTDYNDFTDEDIANIEKIEKIRSFNIPDFNELTAILTKENSITLRTKPYGKFCTKSTSSYVEWEHTTAEKVGFVRICLFNKRGEYREVMLESPHITNIVFNSAWFELKVATILKKWEKTKEILMNCRFPSKEGQDKNEADIVINTGTKILFVECKTQISEITNIDKFASVVKNYGGTGSKGIFITDVPMKNVAIQKCNDNKLLRFSLHDQDHGIVAKNKLYDYLDKELNNINA